MISQKHEDEMQQGEQLSSPVEEKHTTTSSEGRSQQAPTSPRRWILVLLCILGVAMPLVAGSMVNWSWGVGDMFDAEWVFNTVVLALIVSAFVGAFLLCFELRAWWAAVLAPAAWIVGEFLSSVVRPLVEGGWPALQAQEHFWDVQGVIIPYALLPLFMFAIIGATLGIGFSRWWEMRQQRQ